MARESGVPRSDDLPQVAILDWLPLQLTQRAAFCSLHELLAQAQKAGQRPGLAFPAVTSRSGQCRVSESLDSPSLRGGENLASKSANPECGGWHCDHPGSSVSEGHPGQLPPAPSCMSTAQPDSWLCPTWVPLLLLLLFSLGTQQQG